MTQINVDPSTFDASRRDFLWNLGGGLGGIALASLLGDDCLLAAAAPAPRTRVLHRPAKAMRVVQLYMSGAARHCDLSDYKTALENRYGEKFDPGESVELFQSTPDKFLKSPFQCRLHG